MKTATVRDLRNEFCRLSKLLEAGESVQILKRGRPFARIIPEPKAKPFFGSGKGTGVVPPDIDEPLYETWDAMQ